MVAQCLLHTVQGYAKDMLLLLTEKLQLSIVEYDTETGGQTDADKGHHKAESARPVQAHAQCAR